MVLRGSKKENKMRLKIRKFHQIKLDKWGGWAIDSHEKYSRLSNEVNKMNIEYQNSGAMDVVFDNW